MLMPVQTFCCYRKAGHDAHLPPPPQSLVHGSESLMFSINVGTDILSKAMCFFSPSFPFLIGSYRFSLIKKKSLTSQI